jgi:2-hydroxycyclohexanecarboxyl-CoA dehydrogenase
VLSIRPESAERSPSRRHEGAWGVEERASGPPDLLRMSAVSRVAVVTGAASGIGLGVARRFAADGDRVALLDRHGEAAEQAAAELREQGAMAIAHEVDVADWSAVSGAFERVRAELGPIGILVTSAGIESFDAVLDITPEKWASLLAVNLTGTFACIQAALPDMIEAGWGRVVTISSSSAQSGAPYMAHYAASKGGVIGLTKALARELASAGVTVNSVPPTLVDTPMARDAEARGLVSVDAMAAMVPLGRAGTPADIAAACSFLCSEDGGYITGQLIGVNGGMYI